MQPKAITYVQAKSDENWLTRLSAVRLITIVFIAAGYASTMPDGPASDEWLSHLGYQPSWIGIQILFLFSGALALRSLQAGRYGWAYLKSRILHIAPYLLGVTFLTVAVIYPLFADVKTMSITELAGYFLTTVTCINPGQVMPGLLDNAPYACLIQGSIWTLKWGLLFHIIIALLGRVKPLFTPVFLLFCAVISTMLYGVTTYLAVKNEWEHLTPLITAMRLGYVFVIGMALWAYRNHLPKRSTSNLVILLLLLGLAFSKFAFGPWSPIIEISLCAFWGYFAWCLATSKHKALAWMSNWPRLAALLYLINWPIAQILLMSFPQFEAQTLPVISVPLTIVMAVLASQIRQIFKRQNTKNTLALTP